MSSVTKLENTSEQLRAGIVLDPKPEDRTSFAADRPPLQPRKNFGSARLSFAQERLWFLDQINPGDLAANISRGVRISGTLDIDKLKQAVAAVVARHESLRTTFAKNELQADVDGRPTQLIRETGGADFATLDLTSLAEANREHEAGKIAREEAQRPFDSGLGPLLRLMLLRLAERESVLLLNTHRIVCDELSSQVFFDELWAAYQAFANGLLPQFGQQFDQPAIQYADYAEWQREWLQGDVLKRGLEFWKNNLAGAPAVIDLPPDRTRPAVQTWYGEATSMVLPKTFADQLRALSEREQTTLLVILLTAFQVLLARYSGQTDLVIGSAIDERDLETRRLIGPATVVLPLRADLSRNPTFHELIADVKAAVAKARAHRWLPLEKLIEELPVERSLSHAPIFQVMLNLKRADTPLVEVAGLHVRPFDFESGIAPLDLTLNLIEREGELNCRLEYNNDLFDESTAARMLGHFRQVLEGMMANPAQAWEHLPLLTEAERVRVLDEWNDTRVTWAEKSLLNLFAEQVERTPDATAIVFADEQLSYRQLNARANQLAHHLRSLGVGPDTRVGICINRSLEMVIGVLGALKAGGAYVPLDPAYPSERLGFMLADSECLVVLTSELTNKSVATSLSNSEVKALRLDTDWQQVARESSDDPDIQVEPQNLAYVIYTSGSTGWPKGVAMTHRALSNLIYWQLHHSPEPARTLQFASLSFDVSFQEMFSTWCSGGALLLVTDELRRDATAMLRFLVEQRVARIFLPFVYLQHLAEAFVAGGPAPKYLREIITAGEQLEITPQIARLFDRLQDCTLHNHYGPSETHVVTAHTLSEAQRDWPMLPPIGRAIANTRIYILDRQQQPAPIGVPGELCIGGANVSRGYLNRPELTAEKFVPDPFGDRSGTEPGARLYRTGDLARYLNDGNIEFLGRIDNQVKIRGFRIELGEIEATLRTHSAVSDAIVLPRKENDSLTAFVVIDRAQLSGHDATPTSELRSHVAARLPDHMVPALFVEVEKLPLTPSGKVDRRALTIPDEYRVDLGEARVIARDELEENLVRVWEQVLGLKSIGIRDNFFELGGHSLLAARLFAQIENRFSTNLPLATLFQAPTVEQLAAVMRSGKAQREWSSLVAIQPQGARPPLFCVHAAGANVLIYRPLARHLGMDQPVYAFQAQGLDGQSEPYVTVEDMAAHYLQELRAFQPEGPYYLLGASFGGLVAFEMAQRLIMEDERVALLALLNTNCPVYSVAKRIGCHVGHFKQRGARAYLRSAANAARRRVKNISATDDLAVPDQGLQEAIESKADRSDPLVRAVLANLHAENEYAPARKLYPGKIMLFWAQDAEPDFEDNRLAWRKLAQGGFVVHEVPGNHTTMREEPNIGVLVEKLRPCLAV